MSLFRRIADETAAESPSGALRSLPEGERLEEPVFSPLLQDQPLVIGLETIYEGYLLHYGRSRLFAPDDGDVAILLGDALLAHGLVQVAATGLLGAVTDLAELLSLCAQARADGLPGDGPAWAATSALLGRDGLAEARAALRNEGDPQPLETLARKAAGDTAVDAALAAHDRHAVV